MFFLIMLFFPIVVFARIPGDVNNSGDIDIGDYIIIRKYILGQASLSDDDYDIANVDGLESVTSSDYIYIRNVVLGKIPVPTPRPTATPRPTTTPTYVPKTTTKPTQEPVTTSPPKSTNKLKYEDAKNIVKEVMKAYYVKGSKIQYNFAKSTYYQDSPEDATSQKTAYFVCASFATTVQHEAFGMHGKKNSDFPKTNKYQVIRANTLFCGKDEDDWDECKEKKTDCYCSKKDYDKYYKSLSKSNQDKFSNKLENNVIIYIRKGKILYGSSYVGTKIDASNYKDITKNIASIVQPGDIIAYSGHSLIVYDVIKNKNGEVTDALVLNSHREGGLLQSRTYSTSHMYFYNAKGISNTGILDTENTLEGTVRSKLLSDIVKTSFVKQEISTIIRTYYKDSDGNVAFNYKTKNEYIKKSQLRTQYPNLSLEKTVDKVGDLNSVNPGDKLKYRITIKNNSDLDPTIKNKKDYENLVYTETIDLKNVKISDPSTVNKNAKIEGNTITWTFKKIPPGSSYVLIYEVEVIGKVGNIIEAEGKLYNKKNSDVFISSTTVKNKIVSTNNYSEKGKEFENAYNSLKGSYSGLNLINNIYKKVTKKDYHIDSFTFDKILQTVYNKKNEPTGKDLRKISSTNDEISKQYLKMILNNYWNYVYNKNDVDDELDDLVEESSPTGNDEKLPRLHKFGHTSEDEKFRAKTINPSDFKNGDILIYYVSKINNVEEGSAKFESGYYAYIYINGMFKGVNTGPKVNGTYPYKRDTYQASFYSKEKSKYGVFMSKPTTLKENYDEEYLNYQILHDKDYFVVLRPDMIK